MRKCQICSPYIIAIDITRSYFIIGLLGGDHNPNSIILIKRNHKRVMQNFDAIQKIVENFANELKLEFVLHDDSSLPGAPQRPI
jgi:hypothetical protein